MAQSIFGHSHPRQLEIDDWDGWGQAPTFNADEEALRDYERRWRDNTHRYILPELYFAGSSNSIQNCVEAMETLLSLRAASSAGMGCEGTCPLGDNSGEGTSTRVMSDVELTLREEVLQLSALVRGKRGLQKGSRLSDAIIDAPADTSERDRDLAAFEAARMRLEGELQTLRAEMDRLKAEACSEHLVRDALEAQVNELRAKLVSYEASTQSGAIVASIPPHLSPGEERALIHDQYTERLDCMTRCHEEVVADLRRHLDRYHQRAEERGYAFSDSMRAPSQRAPGPSSFASSAIIMELLHRVIVLRLIS